MSSTYAQKQKTAQKKEASTAAAVLDASSQNEGLQRKADMASNAAQRAEALRPNNTGMPDNLKSGIESLSGFSMDDVRVHYNSSKPATVQALAYTQGTDIHVAPGQEKHLPHEAWHVAQQMAGRVSPTTNINGMPVNDNAGLEHEADMMGEKAVQCKEVAKGIIHKTMRDNVSQLIKVISDKETDVKTYGSLRKIINDFAKNGGRHIIGEKTYTEYDPFLNDFSTYIYENDITNFETWKSILSKYHIKDLPEFIKCRSFFFEDLKNETPHEPGMVAENYLRKEDYDTLDISDLSSLEEVCRLLSLRKMMVTITNDNLTKSKLNWVQDCNSRYTYVHRTEKADKSQHLTLDGKFEEALNIVATGDYGDKIEDFVWGIQYSLNSLKADETKGSGKNQNYILKETKKKEQPKDQLSTDINQLKEKYSSLAISKFNAKRLTMIKKITDSTISVEKYLFNLSRKGRNVSLINEKK